MITHTLTGRMAHRHKKRLFGAPLLVLQVEVRIKGYEPDSYGGGRELDYTIWRDATVSDLTITEVD